MHNYYEVTLFTPVILLSALSVVGIILPGDIYFLGIRNKVFENHWDFQAFEEIFFSANAGEKKGFTVTILLGLIVYIDYVQTAIPVWPRTWWKYKNIFFINFEVIFNSFKLWNIIHFEIK